jgi:hypothetical protein
MVASGGTRSHRIGHPSPAARLVGENDTANEKSESSVSLRQRLTARRRNAIDTWARPRRPNLCRPTSLSSQLTTPDQIATSQLCELNNSFDAFVGAALPRSI